MSEQDHSTTKPANQDECHHKEHSDKTDVHPPAKKASEEAQAELDRQLETGEENST